MNSKCGLNFSCAHAAEDATQHGDEDTKPQGVRLCAPSAIGTRIKVFSWYAASMGG